MGDGREEMSGSSSRAIDSSNVGFQLLKKFGWKEGTGLGASEQGRLEPIQTYIKKNKRGLGAEEVKKKVELQEGLEAKVENKNKDVQSRKQKAISKRLKKMQLEEERWKQKEFDRAFFREFWPDNV